jgi:hypothetical protein
MILLISFLVIGCESHHSSDPLRFFVIGDWGRLGVPNQKVVALQMNEWAKKESPKFIVSTGDNFYPIGVDGIDNPHWKTSFEGVYNGENIAWQPWYIAIGNHDYNGNVEAEIQYSEISNRWKLPARYYSFIETVSDGSKIRFIFIDSTPFEKSYYQDENLKDKVSLQDTLRQKMWLDSLTALVDVDWKIVVGHHHIYTGGARRDDANTVRTSLEPIFVKNKVDMYLCGHEHDLQHLKADGKPTHYFVSGAGSDLRPTGLISNSFFAMSIQGFIVISIKREVAEIKIVDYNGKVQYVTEVSHK